MDTNELLELAQKIRQSLQQVRNDRKLSFVEESHKYSIYDPSVNEIISDLPSVSTLITQYSVPFDAINKSLEKTKGNEELAVKLRLEWANKGEIASSIGSYAHYKLEQYVWNLFDIDMDLRKPVYNLIDQDLKDAQEMLKNGVGLVHNIVENGFVPLETECVMGSIDLGYFGQCDNLWLGYHKGKVVILSSDYKTNLSKNFEVRPWNVPMFSPFEQLLDTTLSEYYLQQPLYAQLLSDMLSDTEYGDIPIIGFRILHLRDGGLSIKIPMWVHDEVKKLYPLKK